MTTDGRSGATGAAFIVSGFQPQTTPVAPLLPSAATVNGNKKKSRVGLPRTENHRYYTK